uniref:Uncharacterized protein n=1 Tax=Cacopsylla melanoneura TaxID=428564 RepID=A0A8D8Z4Y6_9HEMI
MWSIVQLAATLLGQLHISTRIFPQTIPTFYTPVQSSTIIFPQTTPTFSPFQSSTRIFPQTTPTLSIPFHVTVQVSLSQIGPIASTVRIKHSTTDFDRFSSVRNHRRKSQTSSHVARSHATRRH